MLLWIGSITTKSQHRTEAPQDKEGPFLIIHNGWMKSSMQNLSNLLGRVLLISALCKNSVEA